MISIFDGNQAHHMARVSRVIDGPWDELVNQVLLHPWAPGIFKEGHRTNASFEAMDWFVCDIDEGMTIEEAKVIFAPYQCAIGTSRSHQIAKRTKPPCDRFRVIIPLSQPITSDADFKATWFEVKKICPAMDPACKDAARFYFPCKALVATWAGAKLIPTKYQALTAAPTQGLAPSNYLKLPPSKRTSNFLQMGAAEGAWHGELVAACLDLKQQRWTEGDAKLKLTAITGHLDDHDEETINDVFANREPRHGPRDEHNEAVRQLISKCHLLQDLSPRMENLFLDKETGEVHNIGVARAEKAMGKAVWASYIRTKALNVFYTYNPYAKPLAPNKEGVLEYNTYRPAPWRHEEFWKNTPVKRLDAMPELFDRFFTHLTDSHGPSKEYLLDWMANSLRTRNFTILTAIGVQGAGKGILGKIFRNLHGETNYGEPKDSVFKERFNAPLKNKTLINVDEISLKTKEEHDRLKAVVNDTIDIEEKGVDAINCRNFASFYISSNHMDAIQIEPGDRRYSIIELSRKKILETDLRPHIEYLTSPEAAAELGAYLLYRPVTHDMMSPFKSPRTREVRLAGLNDWELYVIEEFCPAYEGKTVAIGFLVDDIKVTMELKVLGRRRIIELQKRFPEKFRVFQDPKNPGKRLVELLKSSA